MMGYMAVDMLEHGAKNRIIIYKDGKHTDIDFEEGLTMERAYDPAMYELIKILAI
jgi:hypothetical protein